MSGLPARDAALQQTLGWIKGRRFAWWSADCIRLLRTHLVNNGHAPPPLPHYRSALGAKRALTKAGHADLAALLDSLLVRIPPAAMLAGDVALIEAEPEEDGGGLGALVVSCGRKSIGWIGGSEEAVVMTVHAMKAAWRVDPR